MIKGLKGSEAVQKGIIKYDQRVTRVSYVLLHTVISTLKW